MNKALVGLYIFITLVIILRPGYQTGACGCDFQFRLKPVFLEGYYEIPTCPAMPCLEKSALISSMKAINFLLSPWILALLTVVVGVLVRQRSKIFLIWGLVNLFLAIILPIIFAIFDVARLV